MAYTHHQTRGPLSDAVIAAISRMVDDSSTERRDPSHSDLDYLFGKSNLTQSDPKYHGQSVGKAKRVRAVLSWAMEKSPSAGEYLVGLLIEFVQGCGGFRESSLNYVGRESIENAIQAFYSVGYVLSTNGDLRPIVLDNLSGENLTQALMTYVQRARKGVLDAALLTGTGKDLLEAVAKHVIQEKWGQTNSHSNFPTLLGQAFISINMATPQTPIEKGESALRRYERSLYELGCAVNALRNKEGTGHGRPFLPSITKEEAANAVQAIGIIADYMLRRLIN